MPNSFGASLLERRPVCRPSKNGELQAAQGATTRWVDTPEKKQRRETKWCAVNRRYGDRCKLIDALDQVFVGELAREELLLQNVNGVRELF